MTCAAQIECSRLAPLWKSENIEQSSLDIQIASDCKHSDVDRNFVFGLEAKYADED